MIIRPAHLMIMPQKVLDIGKDAMQLKNSLEKKFTMPNDQAAMEISNMDAKSRELLLQMLAANAQVITTSGQYIGAVYNNEHNHGYKVAMPGLAAPANLTAAPGFSEIVLCWDFVNSAPAYHVKRSLDAGGPYTLVASDIIENSYTDTAVGPGITYYYVVTAVSDYTESGNSNEVSAALLNAADV